MNGLKAMMVALLIAAVIVAGTSRIPSGGMLSARAASSTSCTALELHLAPGLHPPSPDGYPRPAPDAPRTPFAIGLPLYPGLTPLQHPKQSLWLDEYVPAYFQTASAQFHTDATSGAVAAWYTRTMTGCGWRSGTSWNGNASDYPHGIGFARGPHRFDEAEIGFADGTNGTDVALVSAAVRFPTPPLRARIHGPFTQLRIALAHWPPPGSSTPVPTSHRVVTGRTTIARLVRAIDSVKDAFTVPTICNGGRRAVGPAWLTFVRPNGSQVHAFEAGPGVCFGLAVNGFRWLLDWGSVWEQLIRVGAGHR